jgi:hypothetical protein
VLVNHPFFPLHPETMWAVWDTAHALQLWLDARVPLPNTPRVSIELTGAYASLAIGDHLLWDTENYSEGQPTFDRCLERYRQGTMEATAAFDGNADHRKGCVLCSETTSEELLFSLRYRFYVHPRCVHRIASYGADADPSQARLALAILDEFHLNESEDEDDCGLQRRGGTADAVVAGTPVPSGHSDGPPAAGLSADE